MCDETELDRIDAIGTGPGQFARRQGQGDGSPWSASSVVTPMVNSASAIARADSSALTSLASRLAAFRRIVLRSTAAWPNSWASSPVRRSSAASPSSETSS